MPFREDLNRFPYLTMFLKESLRLYPPVVGFGRKLENKLKVKSEHMAPNEVTIPTGTIVVAQVLALHRNPLVWENPEVSNDVNIITEVLTLIDVNFEALV